MVLLRNSCSQIKPRILLAQTGNIDDSIRTIGINDIQRQLLHFGGEQRHLTTLNRIGYLHGCHCSLKDQRHIKQELASSGKQICLIDRPEPQGAPVVHCKLQTRIRTSVAHVFAFIEFAEDFILLADGRMGVNGIINVPKHGQRVLGFCVYFFSQVDLRFPQVINGGRKAQ